MSSSKPKAEVAVITRTKDRPLLLERAIQSVLNQTHPDWLMMIVNDGGAPAPVDALVQKYQTAAKERIHVIRNESSIGMEAASNKGILSSESEYLAIHDDDDAWHPEFLAKTVALLENDRAYQNLGGVICYMEKIWEKIEGDKVIDVHREDCSDWVKEMTLWNMCSGNFFPPISFLYKRSVLADIGMYDEKLPVLGDWDFNLRFMRHYDIALVREILSEYRHRLPGGTVNYANTVIDGWEKHSVYGEMIRNRLLREDLDKKELGLGFLVNIGTAGRTLDKNFALAQKTHEINRHIEVHVQNLGHTIGNIDLVADYIRQTVSNTGNLAREANLILRRLYSPFRLISRIFRGKHGK